MNYPVTNTEFMKGLQYKFPSGNTLEFDFHPFLIGCIGTGTVSNIIKAASDDVPGVPTERKWSHVAIGSISTKGNEIIFIESHFKTGGPRIKSPEKFLEVNKDSEIWAYPYHFFNVFTAEALCKLGLAYGLRDITSNLFAKWSLDVAKFRPDYPGLICSEHLSRSEPYDTIKDRVKDWKKLDAKAIYPNALVQPAHYLRFTLDAKIKGVRLQ